MGARVLLRIFCVVMAFAVASIINSDRFAPLSQALCEEIPLAEITTHTLTSADCSSSIYIPRKTSGTNAPRLQTSAKKVTNAHRINVEFVKCGKLVCTASQRPTLRGVINPKSTLYNPFFRLITLGKLII